MTTPLPQPNNHSTAFKLCLCFLGGNVIYYYLQTALWQSLNLSADFYVYYVAAQTIWNGQPELLYDVDHYYLTTNAIGPYNYPPFLALVLAPFTVISFSTLKLFWLFLNQAVLLASVGIVWMEIRPRNIWIFFCLTLTCMFFGPIIANTHWANVNAIIWFCTTVAWWSFRNEHTWICGPFIAIGIMIKLAPVFLLGYFIYRRAYKVVIYTVITLVSINLMTALVLNGFDTYSDWYTNRLLSLDQGAGKGGSPTDQSVFGFFMRLASQNFIDESLIRPFGFSLMAGIILISYGVCSLKKVTPRDETFDLEYALITILPLLSTTITIPAHQTMLMTTILILFFYLYTQAKIKPIMYWILGLAYALVSFGAFGGAAFSSGWLVLFQSPKLYGTLIFWGVGLFLLIQHKLTKSSQPTPPSSLTS